MSQEMEDPVVSVFNVIVKEWAENITEVERFVKLIEDNTSSGTKVIVDEKNGHLN